MAIQSALVVDDCRMTTLLLRHLLTSEGLASDSAATGLEAIEKTRSRTYDLVLLDIMLPDLDGFEVARRIRAQNAARPPQVYMLTALGEQFQPERVQAVGADGYLSKPVVPSAIRRLVRTVLIAAQAEPRGPALHKE